MDPETGLPKNLITSKPRNMSLDATAIQNRHKAEMNGEKFEAENVEARKAG